jgi:hypothetical protein
VIRAIGDGLVTALQAAGFDEAERRPLPYTNREDCASRKLVVICRQQEYPDGKRSAYDDVVELAIVLQQAADPESNTAVDALLDDVAAIAALWHESGALRHAQLAGADFDDGPSHPTGNLYEPQQLLELRLFTSIMTVRYRLES